MATKKQYYLHRMVKKNSEGKCLVRSRQKTVEVPASMVRDGIPESLEKYTKRLYELGYAIQSFID